MSVALTVKGYAGQNSPEFRKHLKAVKFCIENGLSYPKETSEFFKGKCGGDNLEDIQLHHVLSYIENGVEITLPITGKSEGDVYVRRIKVADIPKEVDEIIISLIY
jgi:hypothetical protein